MLEVKIAMEGLALVIVLALGLSIVVAVRRVRRALPPSDDEKLARFDALMQEHETLHKKDDHGERP